MTATKFHVSNYGRYASLLPRDSEGYCHTTVQGWIDAGCTPEEAEERAAEARQAIADADERLSDWQSRS